MNASRHTGDTYDLSGPGSPISSKPESADLVVARLSAVIRMRDPSLAQHGHRTAEIACAIGAHLGLDVESLDRLYTAAALHDVGKLGVSEAILWKPTGLNHREWAIVRTHPEAGHRLVADVVHHDIAATVLYHHERVDGEGYPFGLPAGDLPLAVRIVQVADAFDAMTSDRPYQGPVPADIGLQEITRCAGTQFDPESAAALTAVLQEGDGFRPPVALRHTPPPTVGPRPAASRAAAASSDAAAPSLISLRRRTG